MTEQPKYVKVRYAADESGWAIELDEGKVELANLPMAAMNIGDVVMIESGKESRPMVLTILARKWDAKSVIRYPAPHAPNYLRLRELFQVARGWPTEGMVPGLLMLAHPSNANLAALANEAGFQIDVEPQPLCPVAAPHEGVDARDQ